MGLEAIIMRTPVVNHLQLDRFGIKERETVPPFIANRLHVEGRKLHRRAFAFDSIDLAR
jgi:hypothetical protein